MSLIATPRLSLLQTFFGFLDSWILGFLDFFGVGGPTPQGQEVDDQLVQWLRQRRITQRVSQSKF